MSGRLHPVIAIDGGAGTGKTTSAARVAASLGYCYVDSGAVYRAVALALRERGGLVLRGEALGESLTALPLRIEPGADRFRVYLGERELGDEIRLPEVSRLASELAVLPEVRARVTAVLRAAAESGPLVVEGRDIGTVVFPDALLKVFLQADLPVRAHRRWLDLERQGCAQPEEEVAREMAQRDVRDSTRTEAPLRRAEGALVVDTSRTDIEGQVRAILEGVAAALRAKHA